MNFDGAIFREQNSLGVGVVIRDDKGEVVASMDKKITLSYLVTVVEVIVAKRALKLALDIDLSPIVLEGDSKNTIDALMCEGSLLVNYGHLVDDAKRLANQFEFMEFSYVKSEGNKAVHNIVRHVNELSVWMKNISPYLFVVIQAKSTFC